MFTNKEIKNNHIYTFQNCILSLLNESKLYAEDTKRFYHKKETNKSQNTKL